LQISLDSPTPERHDQHRGVGTWAKSWKGIERALERRFAEALSGMNYDNPTHRAVLDAEGLHHWVEPHLDGYTALRDACVRQGFFSSATAKSAAE